LAVTPEVAFSNALVAARQAFPNDQVDANGDHTMVVVTRRNFGDIITIAPVTVFDSEEPSLRGVLYDLRTRSLGGTPRTWSPPYSRHNFNKAYASNFPAFQTTAIKRPRLARQIAALPTGIRISIEVPEDNLNREIGLDVLDLTFEEALTLAYETAQSAFPQDRIETSPDRSFVQVTRDSSSQQYLFRIEPRIIKTLSPPEDSGILFRFIGSTPMAGPSGPSRWQAQNRFEEAFWKTDANRTPAKWFADFRLSFDRGVPDRIASSIPTTYVGFKNYLEGRKGLLPFEGIWTEADGIYTLGIVHAPSDPRFKYHAFVIESKRSGWQPGEIKAKFSDLKANKIATGDYRISSKALFGLSWKVDRELLAGVSSVLGQNILLIKTYPTSAGSDFISGVGTAWAVTESGTFVTAAHVVEGASKIFIGLRENTPQEASVLMLDQKLDLAVVKTKGDKGKYRPIPIRDGIVSNGTEITALGYPLAFDLGDDVKVTAGLVSSQSGRQRDVTMYQMSAPVQPGNSGGPVIDNHGNAVGVVVERLPDATVGTDVELVNYAVKSPYLKPLLDAASIQAAKQQQEKVLSTQEIADMYKASVLPIWTEK